MLQVLAFVLSVLVSTEVVLSQQTRQIPPVKAVIREELEAARARREAGIPEPPMTAEYKERYDAFLARLEAMSAERTDSLTAADAMRLIDSLYEDMGDPFINGRWQYLVVLDIKDRAHTAADKDVEAILRAGLLEYAVEGGGADTPSARAALACVLARFGGPQYPECDQMVLELAKSASKWAEELQSTTFIHTVQGYRENLDRVLAHTQGAARKTTIQPAGALQAHQEAEAAVRVLGLSERPAAWMVEKAAKLATVDSGKREINEDMISRLLIGYRSVLERREEVRKEVVQAVDQKLLWLPRDARKLATERHWSLWADAVTALGRVRASHALEKYVFHDTLKSEREPAVVKEIERAREGLRRSSSPKPQRPSTSQPAAPTTQPRG